MFAAVTDPEAEAEDERRRRRNRWIAIGLLAAILIGLLAVLLADRLGGDKSLVPAVTGKDVERAADQLEAAGFEVEIDEFANEASRGTVLEQDPRAGEEADEGSTVTLSVSSGPGEGEIPDVVGQPEAEAKQELEDAGFRVKSERETSSSVDAGDVIRSEPSPGLRARVGSTVMIFVSSGPKMVSVPDVLNQSESSARSELRAANLLVNVESEESELPEDTVIEQDPTPGSSVEEGEQVTIVLSEGPGDVSVPNVVGQSRESAVARLSALGLNIRIVEVETESQSEDGDVLDQVPSPGTNVPPGSDVTIDVGVFVEPEEEPPTDETTTTTVP
jgi:eukaryotic-like serine/threonine-protein kinase